jgi:hypothetical protein
MRNMIQGNMDGHVRLSKQQGDNHVGTPHQEGAMA